MGKVFNFRAKVIDSDKVDGGRIDTGKDLAHLLGSISAVQVIGHILEATS